jgi:hypothetical protein
VSEYTRCIWYHVTLDIIPTHVRLHHITMVPSDICRRCTATDILEHRLLACGQGRKIWHYMKPLLARMMRTIPTHIPDDWPFRPHLSIWPSQKHRAILWLLAYVVIFRMQQQSNLTLHDYMDFLHRTRWKLTRNKDGSTLVGNYLTVLDTNWKKTI